MPRDFGAFFIINNRSFTDLTLINNFGFAVTTTTQQNNNYNE